MMKESFQELLYSIPMHQLNFLFPLPAQELFYKHIVYSTPEQWLAEPTLLVIGNNQELEKLNAPDTTNRLIQDPNLTAVILCTESNDDLEENMLSLYEQCQIPVIRLEGPVKPELFSQKNNPFDTYGQVSMELYGFIKKGFINVASQIAFGLGTPLLYLDENNELLWHTGEKDDLREANRWVNIHRRKLTDSEFLIENQNSAGKNEPHSFHVYPINIGGLTKQKLIADAKLLDWQRRLIHKLTGLTALLLQTEGMFQEQQEQFQAHFIHDLLYHKFESHQAMIKQAKTWGWNLEKPHHLLLIDVQLSEAAKDENWLDDILTFLEQKKKLRKINR